MLAISVFATLAISSSMKSDPKSGSHMMQNGQSMSGSSMSGQGSSGGGEMKMGK